MPIICTNTGSFEDTPNGSVSNLIQQLRGIGALQLKNKTIKMKFENASRCIELIEEIRALEDTLTAIYAVKSSKEIDCCVQGDRDTFELSSLFYHLNDSKKEANKVKEILKPIIEIALKETLGNIEKLKKELNEL